MVALLERRLDWGRALHIAASEGAQPVFSRTIRRVGERRLPDDLEGALRRLEQVSEIRAVYMQRRLTETLDVMSQSGIRIMLLKGAALAKSVFRGFTERPMSDLDLLVESGSAREAWRLMQSTGWEPRAGGRFDEWYDELHHLPPLQDSAAPSLNVSLEVHTDLFPPDRNPFELDGRRLWEACGFPSSHPCVAVPPADHLLLHCCLHFGWLHMLKVGAWRALRDVAGLARGGRINWDGFAELAEEVRGATCAYWTLTLARDLAEAKVPEPVLESLRPAMSAPVRRLVERHLRGDIVRSERNVRSHRVRRRLWEAALRPEVSGHGGLRPWQGTKRDWEAMRIASGGSPT